LSDDENEPVVNSKVPLSTQPAHLPSDVHQWTSPTRMKQVLKIFYQNMCWRQKMFSYDKIEVEKEATGF